MMGGVLEKLEQKIEKKVAERITPLLDEMKELTKIEKKQLAVLEQIRDKLR